MGRFRCAISAQRFLTIFTRTWNLFGPRRRTRVVRVFPNDASLVRLASALVAERNEQWMEQRYLIMDEPPQAEHEVRQSAWAYVLQVIEEVYEGSEVIASTGDDEG